jgi:hypothetical protein
MENRFELGLIFEIFGLKNIFAYGYGRQADLLYWQNYL